MVVFARKLNERSLVSKEMVASCVTYDGWVFINNVVQVPSGLGKPFLFNASNN